MYRKDRDAELLDDEGRQLCTEGTYSSSCCGKVAKYEEVKNVGWGDEATLITVWRCGMHSKTRSEMREKKKQAEIEAAHDARDIRRQAYELKAQELASLLHLDKGVGVETYVPRGDWYSAPTGRISLSSDAQTLLLRLLAVPAVQQAVQAVHQELMREASEAELLAQIQADQ